MGNNKENNDSQCSCQHGCQQDPSADNQFEGQIKRIFEITNAKNPADLARILNISSQSVNSVIGPQGRKKIPNTWFTKIADKYKVSSDYLRTGEGTINRERPIIRDVGGEYKVLPQIPESNGLIPESFILIPYVESHLGAGDGSFIQSDSLIELYAFRKDWLQETASSWENLILMPVRGPSMEKTISDGDVVMVDTGRREIIRDLIYAVRIQETIAVKRVQRLPDGRIRLTSDNDKYPPEEFFPGEIQILGRIIWLARDQIK